MTGAKIEVPVAARDGAVLHLEGVGAPTALMVHGLGYASWEADELRTVLSADIGLWSLDNRGAGRSPEPAGDCSIATMADDAAAAIRAIGAPIDLIAHSMGGYIAQQLALDHPSFVRRMVLIATSAGGPDAFPVPAETLQAWLGADGLLPGEYARRTMPISFRPGWVEEHPADFERLLQRRLAHPTGPASWRKQFAACEDFLSAGSPSERIIAPTLIIHGALDRVVPVENGRALALRIPGAGYHEFDDGGHLVHLEQPDDVGLRIGHFLSPHPQPEQ